MVKIYLGGAPPSSSSSSSEGEALTRRCRHDVVGCCGMSLRQHWRGLWSMLGMGIGVREW